MIGTVIKNTLCPICGGTKFERNKVLWPELITEWELQPHEAAYIDEQQGLTCTSCLANLRTMTLAKAVVTAFRFTGLFRDWVADLTLAVLEINEAHTLTPFLSQINGHELVKFPKVDMHALPYSDGSFDLVIHSDTLEHVADPITALGECRRVLRSGGHLAFTIPIIVGRMSRSRAGMPPSFHGAPGDNASDYLVHTEFGADFWDYTMQAGFERVEIFCSAYPAGLAIVASNLS